MQIGFNVFDVMRHGSHEKQLSNVFAWLLNPDLKATHGLKNLPQQIFLSEINRGLPGARQFRKTFEIVVQELNTADDGNPWDIADIVLENDTERVVIENYYTSDGHGHSYAGYLAHAERDGKRGAVVLLCRDQDSSLQSDGWENAHVVTYGAVVTELHRTLSTNHGYQRDHPDAYSFIDQMYRRFVKGRGRVEDRQLLEFMTAMCATGAAGRYARQAQQAAAEEFGDAIRDQAIERFGEGREVLQRVKNKLRSYSEQVLGPALNETFGDDFVRGVSANYRYSYQWTINFDVDSEGEGNSEAPLQLKFGPSAWFANEKDSASWKRVVEDPDYSRVFITRASRYEIRQTSVSLAEVLDGLPANDRRLHDAIIDLWRSPGDEMH
ncbi:PD-(D/E)XK nuclease superfamily protein [Branchiibius hedensis]|uniref:PD-(D/E)XK nuclease superfamily protein n=2 Tax=Branchiibius hedensis TaxID=672460 RepID=A0A2Y8ZS67_9MICO|nr:PD-(D/E)XK nuclease superfamily protein [Branchiibius hedensis]SSA34296.1 PD-(D/E)XK nuclease superfamily protein [Branchiibius hedensis]